MKALIFIGLFVFLANFSPISGEENVLDQVGNFFEDIVEKIQQGLDSTQIDDDIMNFFSKFKNDEQVTNALSKVGSDLKDTVGNIFNDLVFSDYKKLEKKLEKGGLIESVPDLKDALISGNGEQVVNSLKNALSDLKNSFDIVLDHTKVDDEVMSFLINLKNDDNLKQALKNTGSNLADMTSDIFVHVRDEDMPNLRKKLKEVGVLDSNGQIEPAFAEKLQQLENSSNVVKAINLSAIFCLVLFFKLF